MGAFSMPRSQWLMLVGLVLCFVVLAVVANTGQVPAVDKHVLLLLRDPMDSTKEFGPAWLAELIRDITALGSNWLLLFFCFSYAIYLTLAKKKHLATYLLITVVVGMAANFALKLGFDRPRPELVPHGTRVYTSSFPSGHAMASSLVWLTLAFVASWDMVHINAKRFLIGTALFVSLAVAFSRLFMAVHWPTDVLAGLCAGIFWAVLCHGIARHYFARHCKDKDAI